MSKAQKIDDHSNWIGSGSKESPLPMNSKMKQFESAVGAGSELDYEDKTSDVKQQQDKGIAKIKSHPMKPNYRN